MTQKLQNLFAAWLSSYKGLTRDTWLLAGVNLVNRMGGMVTIFLSVYLTDPDHLAFPLTVAGYVMTCGGIGGLVGTFLGGWLADRIGYFNVQTGSLLFNGLLLISLILIRDPWVMGAAVFVMNVASESFRPANQIAMAQFSAPETRTRSIALMRLAYNLGFSIAPAMGGIVAYNLGWTWLFWIDGITCLLAAGALFWWLRPKAQPRATHPTANAAAEASISPFLDARFMRFVLFQWFGAVAFMQMMCMVPVFFRDGYHWNENQIGWAMAINGAIVVFVEMPLLFRIEGKRPNMTYVRFGLVLYMLAYAMLIGPMWGFWAMLAFMVAISFGEIFVMPFSSNLVLNYVADRPNRGRYLAAYGLSYQLANAMAPWSGAQVVTHWGFSALWAILIGCVGIAWWGFRGEALGD
jgi:predicted MFS family arabinose efflux permease